MSGEAERAFYVARERAAEDDFWRAVERGVVTEDGDPICTNEVCRCGWGCSGSA